MVRKHPKLAIIAETRKKDEEERILRGKISHNRSIKRATLKSCPTKERFLIPYFAMDNRKVSENVFSSLLCPEK